MIRNFLQALRQFIIPMFCFYCRTYNDRYCCSSCSELIRPILATRIVLDKGYQMDVHAVSAYEDPVKSLILAKGWSDYNASIILGKLIWSYSVLKNIPFDYLVPIPLHYTRYAWRGYNHAEVIAQELARLSGKPVMNVLRRSKRTPQQAHFRGRDRYKNVEEAFQQGFHFAQIEGKVLVLIDDVMTSGATLQAAGNTLIQGCPQKIYSVVACRAL